MYNAASKRRYYVANRERLIQAVIDRTDPVQKAAYDREYNQRPEVRERKAAQRKAWALRNPEKAAAHNRSRSHARRQARPDRTANLYMQVLLGDPCSYCGGFMEHVDHIVPLAAQGTSAWDNLTAACKSCNFSKRSKSLLTFLLTTETATQ